MAEYTTSPTTRDYIGTNDLNVEAGDMVNEMGKVYTGKVKEAIESHRLSGLSKIFILVESKKHSSNWNEIHLNITVFPRRFSKMYESMDYFEYDYKEDKLKLLWSVPEMGAMKMYLRDPEKYNPKFIEWIKRYLKQEGINLKKIKSKVIELPKS